MLPPSTSRLILREATEDDAGFMLELLTEPSWKRFIRDHDVSTEAAALDYLKSNIISHYGDGYGFWIVEPRNLSQPAGVCGLIKRDHLNHPDIGFGFLEKHWGQGYAAEASQAVIVHAFEALELPILWAVTRPDNNSSIRLLTELGFQHSHQTTDHDSQVISVYELTGDRE